MQPSTPTPSASRRGTLRGSHLRQVSSGSADSGNSIGRSISSTGTAIEDPVPLPLLFERLCNLWIHDDVFSKDEVVLNLDLFPDIKAGDLMAIVALKTDSGVREFQDQTSSSKVDLASLGSARPRERSSSNPKSPVGSAADTKQDLELGKRYMFIARDMPKELKAKHTSLEVSVAKNIADVFSFKHRSNVLLTSVCLHVGAIESPVLTCFPV
jgi:hypothetical protein